MYAELKDKFTNIRIRLVVFLRVKMFKYESNLTVFKPGVSSDTRRDGSRELLVQSEILKTGVFFLGIKR